MGSGFCVLCKNLCFKIFYLNKKQQQFLSWHYNKAKQWLQLMRTSFSRPNQRPFLKKFFNKFEKIRLTFKIVHECVQHLRIRVQRLVQASPKKYGDLCKNSYSARRVSAK